MKLRFGHQAILHDKEGGASAPGVSAEKAPEVTGTTQPQGDGAGDGAGTPKTYTQAEFDALLAQRLTGQGKELKNKDAELERFRAAEAARKAADEKRKLSEMSEVDKAKALAADAIARAAAAEAARDEAFAKSRRDKAESEARAEVSAYGVTDEDVYSLIPSAALDTDDDGKRTADAKAALEKWITAKTGTLLRGKGGATGPAASVKQRGAGGEERTGVNAELRRWRDAQKARS